MSNDTRYFVRRQSGDIDVQLSQFGRDFVRSVIDEMVTSRDDETSPWHGSFTQPNDPSKDSDDIGQVAAREVTISSTLVVTLETIDADSLTESEAWAWLRSLQLVLRFTSAKLSLSSDDDVEQLSDNSLNHVRGIQGLLFDLAECLG